MEAQDQTRIESRIADFKYNMWDKLPPTYLPSGKLIINTNIESSPTITFMIPARSTDVKDESGEFGIRKRDKGPLVHLEIYLVSNDEVIKQSTSYSKFFNREDWDPGLSELGGNIFEVFKQIPVTIHEKIDGTVRSAKDVNYKYPQIFDIEWKSRNDGTSGTAVVALDFTIRKDITDFALSYSINRLAYITVRLEPIRSSSAGTSYQWTTTDIPTDSNSNISFLIVTGINQDLETELTYTVQ